MKQQRGNTILERIDITFSKNMKECMKVRLENDLAKFNSREISMAEATRLAMRTPSWQKVMQELKTLPKKENLI
jgi:hypothetical protein